MRSYRPSTTPPRDPDNGLLGHVRKVLRGEGADFPNGVLAIRRYPYAFDVVCPVAPLSLSVIEVLRRCRQVLLGQEKRQGLGGLGHFFFLMPSDN